MFKKIKKEEALVALLFIFSFLLFFCFNVTDNNFSCDKIWTFHMTQKIALGEVPYNEINIIITPLFYQLGAILFKITGQATLLTYAIYGGLIGAFITVVLYKLCREFTDSKLASIFATSLLANMLLQICETNYNFFILGIIIWIILLEIRKEKEGKFSAKYNILLGFALGICAAIKHTVGGVFILTSLAIPIIKKLLHESEKISIKEILYKLIGIITVGLCYLVWLISIGALESFIDFAILGLVDFAEKNNVGGFFCVFTLVGTTIIIMFLMLYNMYKENGRKNIVWLICAIYSISNFAHIIPLCNNYHVFIFTFVPIVLCCCFFLHIFKWNTKKSMLAIIVFFIAFKFGIKFAYTTSEILYISSKRWDTLLKVYEVIFYIEIATTLLIIFLNKLRFATMFLMTVVFAIPIITNMCIWKINVRENEEYYIPEYSCVGMLNSDIKDVLEVNKYILEKEAEGYKVLVLDINASKYMIPLKRNNYKYDLLLNGNLGFNGEEKIIDDIKKEEKIIILNQGGEYAEKMQFSKKIDKFIKENYENSGKINNLTIYIEK